MKVILLLLGLALAGAGGCYFYFTSQSISWTQGLEVTAAATPAGRPGSVPAGQAGKKDFKELSTRLQTAMDQIPVRLRDARQLPTFALDTRSRLAPYVQLHAEYVTVTAVCDTIIDADQAFAEHQEKCGLAPAPAGASPQERARMAAGQNPATYQQQQALWDSQRLQADSRVRQLLATLENRQL